MVALRHRDVEGMKLVRQPDERVSKISKHLDCFAMPVQCSLISSKRSKGVGSIGRGDCSRERKRGTSRGGRRRPLKERMLIAQNLLFSFSSNLLTPGETFLREVRHWVQRRAWMNI